MKKLNALALAIMGISSAAYASEQEGWQFEFTPYIWGVAANGDLTARGQTAELDEDINDAWDNVDEAFMALGVVSYNRLVVYLNYDYLNKSVDGTSKRSVGNVFPIGTELKAETDAQVMTGAIGYRFDTFGDKSFIDVMVGYRTLSMDVSLHAGPLERSHDNDTGDTIILLRPSFQLSENWRFNPTMSYGVDGDSDTTYSLEPQFQYNFTDTFAMRFGYKNLHYETESGTEGTANFRKWDGDFAGPFIGLGFTFPAKAKPVEPAPAPIVAAPPPEKCADVDGDGVCDTADQCPNTPPGKRVGPAGCDCDYTLTTHFEFNSAKLTEYDKVELDKLAEMLANPNLHFVTGEIDGYTDSVGKPEYNMKLSKRRADAVADYLASKGVGNGSRMNTNGFGEDNPAADNETKEGRAENRRVVIRRTDCPAQ